MQTPPEVRIVVLDGLGEEAENSMLAFRLKVQAIYEQALPIWLFLWSSCQLSALPGGSKKASLSRMSKRHTAECNCCRCTIDVYAILPAAGSRGL